MILEFPEDLQDGILLITSELVQYLDAPIIKVERKLNSEQAKEMLKAKRKKFFDFSTFLGTEPFAPNPYELITDLKEELIRKDLFLLGQIIAGIYTEKIKHKVDIDYDQLSQIIEIDWTYKDLCLGDTQIHYEIFTKRDLVICSE